MSLRVKTMFILLSVFVLYGTLTYLVQQKVVFPSFVSLEQEEATKNMHRVLGAIDREIEVLRASANDWSIWDDTQQYLQDHNSEYEESNLGVTTLTGMQLNLMNLYDLEGNLVWGAGYDPVAEEEIALGELSRKQLSASHPLLAGPFAEKTVGGIYMTPQGPMLVVSNPVLNNQAEGPSGGALLMGRLLNAEAVERLAKQAQLQLTLTPVSDRGLPSQLAKDASKLVASSPSVLDVRAKTINVSTVVADIGDNPAVRIEVVVPRDITARGQDAMTFAMASLIGVGILVLFVIMLLLQRTVLRPLTLLTEHAVRIGEHNDLSGRIALDRRDEIGILARELDRMVGRLAEARSNLLEQSYYAGIAETSSAVLHNIGNAVTPLYLKLNSAKEHLRRAPVGNLEKAFAELTDDATTKSRRADLSRYVELAGQELANKVRKTEAALENVGDQVMHVQQILSDQVRFSRAKPVVEPVDIGPLIKDALRFLPENVRRSTAVRVDNDVEQIGAVRASRVPLQQVISNLVINGAEAIAARATATEPGRIEISAQLEAESGQAMGHFRFTDNGAGIDPDQMQRIFERGFSTKECGSGLGLHWSANTVTAMGGRIFAESAGVGQGATLHLVLPMASLASEPLETAA